MNFRPRWFFNKNALLIGAALAALAAGCTSPMERSAEQRLRETLLASNKLYKNAIAGASGEIVTRTPSKVESDYDADPERAAELEKRGGPASYNDLKLELGRSLTGNRNVPIVNMTLERAIQLAVQHNLEVQQARLLPAISQTQITQAEAAFDAVVFSNLDWQKLDTPRPITAEGVSDAFGSTRSETYQLTTGIRKLLSTGGEVRAQTTAGWNFSNPSFFGTAEDPAFSYHEANVLVGLNQPLLRNFGNDVTRSQVALAHNARGQSVQDLHRQLLETVVRTEAAYWDLVFARHRVLIQQRLLARTQDDYDLVKIREPFDANPVRITQAASFLEARRAELMVSQSDLWTASVALKRLINDPELPLTGDAFIMPVDFPVDAPIKVSLVDLVATALRRRPELKRAILEIDDASIRLMVADNLRLPQLNLSAAIRYNGVGGTNPEAYQSLADGQFIDYLVGFQFEMPIGNLGAHAAYRQRQIEREAITFNYRRAVQDVLKEVDDVLRKLATDYELIGLRRAARLAATDNLRAWDALQEIGAAALTAEFLLDQKLSSEQRLAEIELLEMQALTQYNTDVARLYQVIGTLLERNNIEFEDIPREAVRPARNQFP